MMKQLIVGLMLVTALTTVGQAANCVAPGSMASVRTYKSGNWDIVEFKIKSPATYTKSISATTGPFTFSESDEEVVFNGALFTRVHFETLDWTCETPNRFTVMPVVKDVKLVEKVEGYVTYVIGRKAGSHYLSTVDVPCGSSRCVRVKFAP
jgi:GH35 family endo-1,4-beta-xylanase